MFGKMQGKLALLRHPRTMTTSMVMVWFRMRITMRHMPRGKTGSMGRVKARRTKVEKTDRVLPENDGHPEEAGKIVGLMMEMKSMMHKSLSDVKTMTDAVTKNIDTLDKKLDNFTKGIKGTIVEELTKDGGKVVADAMDESTKMNALLQSQLIYRKAIMKSQMHGVQGKLRIIGIPKYATVESVKAKLKDYIWEAHHVDVWKKKGETDNCGIAEVHFKTNDQRFAAVKKCNEWKPTWDSRREYMNMVKTELEEDIDKPLRDAMKNLKGNWQGEEKTGLRMAWKERAILYNETVLCVQNVNTLEMEWKIAKKDCVSNDAIAKAPAL